MTLTGLVLAVLLAADDDGLGLGSRVAVREIDGIIVDDEALLEQIHRFQRDGPSPRSASACRSKS